MKIKPKCYSRARFCNSLYGGVFSIIAIDIDHFKKINDRFGHAGGDEVLMAVAAIFNDALRRNVDLVARVGGEEFMLLLPQTDESGAIDLAERLRRHLADMPVSIGGESVSITASFGVKRFDGRSDPERLTIEADDALYKAKRGGRNCVVACSVW
jgi:diguanylate cyclase